MRYLAKIALCLAVLFGTAMASFADVTTNPSRLVLNNETRAGQIDVHNSGHHTLRIESGWTDIAQGEDGVLHPVPQGPAPDTTKGLHLWPQNFTLKPDETRAVYVVFDPEAQVSKEQRVHMRINADRVNGKGPRWGLTLPVFVRPQNLPVTAEITNVSWAGPQSLFVSLYRKGGASPYGRLAVSDDNGTIIGELGNVSLYVNGRAVRYEIPLETLPTGGGFVSYLGSGEFTNQVFDQIRFGVKR